MTRTMSRRPQISEPEVTELAAELYSLDVEQVDELPGDSDRNFRLLDRQGERYVFKVAGPQADLDKLDLQERIFACLTSHGLQVPRVVPVAAGGSRASWQDAEGSQCSVRLLTYLPGKVYVTANPHSAGLRRSVGRLLGRLDRALEEIDSPASESSERVTDWDLTRAGGVIAKRLDSVEDDDHHRVLAAVAERFEAHVEPSLAGLRRGWIHSDANDHNLVVESSEYGDYRVSGIFDFGDLIENPIICEVAIAAAYALLKQEDPLSAAADVASGFHETNPLQEIELAVLFDLIRARLAVSASMAAYQRKLEPDNEYLSVSAGPALVALQRLAEVTPEFAEAMFRVACGYPASAKSAAVRGYLAAAEMAPVVDGDLSQAEVLDLSVASPMGGSAGQELNGLIFGQMAAANAAVGIGRYDEPRLLYQGEQFTAGDLAARTIHIGLDLFQPAGSPVYAPLDGVVHSFANNALPLDYGPTIILSHRMAGGEEFYTLYGHLDTDSLAGLFEGMKINRGDQLGRMGALGENGGWPPHLHFQVMLELLGKRGDFPGVAPPDQRQLWCQLCPDPNLLVRVPKERFPRREMSAQETLESRQRLISPSLSISYRKPLKIVRGRGQYLYDDHGRRYLDSVNNVPHVGHCHPRVVAAGQQQMAVLNTNTRYLHDNLVRYAERLTASMPDPLSVCFFCCTGSEANDLALRMARIHTGHRDFITVEGAYHGHTNSLIEISPYKYLGPGGAGAPEHVHEVAMPDAYRGSHSTGEEFAAEVKQAVVAAGDGGGVAAFICESILGCGGQVMLPEGYFVHAYQHVRAAGGICIADEVQVGFGRVGSHLWAFETQGVVPDIVTLGKPIGNGHPMSAVITTPEIAASFANGMEYFNTFGGNPVSCAIGMAVLDVIEDEGLVDNARVVGARLLAGLEALQSRHAIIGQARGLGLFVGVELVRDRETLEPAAEQASYIAERMRDHGILISTDGPLHNVLKMKPPIVFTVADADRLVSTLDGVMAEDASQP